MLDWWENFLDWWNPLPNNEAMFYAAIITTLLGGISFWLFNKKKESVGNTQTTDDRAANLHKGTGNIIHIMNQPSNFKILTVVFYLVVVLAVWLIVILFNGKTKEPIETPTEEITRPIEDGQSEEITKTEAFEILFGSGWEVSPYSDEEKYPCYKYQGKWELYEKNDYFLKVGSDPFIYYKPISVVAYMWCQPDVEGTDAKESIENGYMLKGIELLKNSVHKSKNEIDSITDLNDENLIGIMSGLLIDVITFDLKSKEPTKRDSERIGRHHYNSIKKSDNTKNIINFITELKPTNCSITEKGSKESYKGKDGETQQRLLENYRIKFNCKHKGARDGNYIKQLTFKGKVPSIEPEKKLP